MKMLKSFTALALLALFFSGCAATSSSKPAVRRFHESRSVNVVLQFSSWEYTFLLRPRYDEDGFLLQVPRDKVGQVLSRMNIQQRNLAVVVVGWNYTPEQMHKLVTDWKLILGGCGFQRVVLLKSSGRKELNGSLVIDDSTISGAVAPSFTQL